MVVISSQNKRSRIYIIIEGLNGPLNFNFQFKKFLNKLMGRVIKYHVLKKIFVQLDTAEIS